MSTALRAHQAMTLLFLVAFSAMHPMMSVADTLPTPPPVSRQLGLHTHADFSATYIDQNTTGTGQVGPESSGFINGSPLSPNTPYDFFSSAPEVPGIAGMTQMTTTATLSLRKFDIRIIGAIASVQGSVTNASYWGENLMPTLNPHLGSQALPYAIIFPTHPGQDDASAVRASLLSGSLATANGALHAQGGWFDLTQTNRCIFAPPALTNVNPTIAYAPAESLTSGLTGLASWQPTSSALPLHGIDLSESHGITSYEITHAALPSLPGEAATLSMGSAVVDHGEGTRYSVQMLHATTNGASFLTTVPFGVNPQFTQTTQGNLPTSTLSGQHQGIAGFSAAFHLDTRHHVDALTEVARSWYSADPVANPGSQRPGGYYHLGLSQKKTRTGAFFDLYRMEARYAPMILPYGVAENQWSAAFAWPGQWLKSNYQLIDNSVLGVNRQGYRLRYDIDKGPLELHTEYTSLRQIDPETTVTSTQSGFVDGYYLPQSPNVATLGTQKRYAFWCAWHPHIGDLTLDFVDDVLARPFAATEPSDAVSYHVPQVVVSYGKHFSDRVALSVGLGRYGMKGTFSEPIDITERLFFLGTEVKQSALSSLLITYRRSAVNGISTVPMGPSPNFSGSLLLIEQRLAL